MGKALLIIVFGFTMVFGGIMFNVTANHQRASKTLEFHYDRLMARYTSQSIANVAMSRMMRDSSVTFSSTLNGVSFTSTATNVTGDSTVNAQRFLLSIAATADTLTDTLRTIVIKPAFSYYYYFVENWPGFITYGATDTIPGPLHANDPVQVVNSPVFMQKMTTDDTDHTNYTSVNFRDGVQLGTNIPLPPVGALQNIDDIATAAMTPFINEVWIQFNGAGGAFQYSNTSTGPWALDNLSNYNVISTASGSGADIHVSGQYNGSVTIISDGDMYIDNNITPVNAATDFLGLITVDSLYIDYTAGMNTIAVSAALLARNTIIQLDPLGAATNFILQGSLAADNDNLTVPRNHLYDSRLRTKTPPYFPRSDRYETLYRSF